MRHRILRGVGDGVTVFIVLMAGLAVLIATGDVSARKVTKYVSYSSEVLTKEVETDGDVTGERTIYHERLNNLAGDESIETEFTLAALASSTIALPAGPCILHLRSGRAEDHATDTDLLKGDPLPVDLTGAITCQTSEIGWIRLEDDIALALGLTITNLTGAPAVRVRVVAEEIE